MTDLDLHEAGRRQYHKALGNFLLEVRRAKPEVRDAIETLVQLTRAARSLEASFDGRTGLVVNALLLQVEQAARVREDER